MSDEQIDLPQALPLISRQSPWLVDCVSLARFARLDAEISAWRKLNAVVSQVIESV